MISLNVNGLNPLFKRYRVVEWLKKQDPSICCLQEAHLRPKGTYQLKVKDWKNIYCTGRSKRKAKVAILRQNRL